MGPTAITGIALNKKFLAGQAEANVQISSPGSPALMKALRDGTGVIPPGEITLREITATAGGDGTLEFGGGGTQGGVKFSGRAAAGFEVGVYLDAADALNAVEPSAELSGGLKLTDPEATRYLVVHAFYNLRASAKGSVALGAGASANFGVSGDSRGLFAVLHRFHDAEQAINVFGDTFRSWGLPRQIDSADELKPATWLIAEVDGSFAMKAGVQAGYDFTWLREIPGGALQGDIGLRVQLGASAVFGFEASGKYHIVLGREGTDPILRLRLYKAAKKGVNFAIDARVGVKATLPPFFAQKHKAEDLVAAIFGLNNNQLIEDLREARAFVNSNTSLQDKLAGLFMELGGKKLEDATGLSPEEIRAAFEKGRAAALDLIGKFDNLTKTGGHDVTSMLLSLTGVDLDNLEGALQQLAKAADAQALQELVRGLLSAAGFERLPIGRFIEAAAGPPLVVLTGSEAALKLQSTARRAIEVLSGKKLQQVLDYISNKVNLDRITSALTQADFDTLDNWLKARLSAFLGKQRVVFEDLQKVQSAVQSVFKNVDKFYEAAIAAAKAQQEFSFSATYARSTSRTALVDVSFDLREPGTLQMLRDAVNGDLNELLLAPAKGVTLAEAELTHNIRRNVSSALMMPFGSILQSAETISTASLEIVEDHGRVLMYRLDASSEEKQRKSLFNARAGRDSTLTVAATMPLATGGVKVWKEGTFSYSYRMERAVQRMRVSQFQEEVGPLMTRYFPSAFAGPVTFPVWVADLDKALDARDPNSGTHDIGDTLVTLSLSAPPAYLRAWTKAPAGRKDPAYMELSRALQARLKELVTFFCFSDPAAYADLKAAAAPIVYSCLPVSTSIKLNSDEEVEKFNTGKDVYWDQVDTRQVRAMVTSRQTVRALEPRMKSIAAILGGIPSLQGTAQFYEFDQINLDRVISDALHRFSASSTRPELLGSLLDLEARLVDSAVRAGSEIGQFRQKAGVKPASALKNLAQFGEALVDTFNGAIGNHPFLSGASKPLATLLFVEAARQFDPTLTGKLAALMNITVIKSGKLKVNDMLEDKITPDLVLFEQPFVEA